MPDEGLNMEPALDISAEIPEATVRGFVAAFTRYKDDLGNSQANAIRRGTIALIKSLRAWTPATKKRIPRRAVQKGFVWGFNKGTGKNRQQRHFRVNGHDYHWFEVNRLTADGRETKHYLGDSAAEVWRERGGIYRNKLAKKSWGHFMQLLFGRAEPNDNPNAKVTDKMAHGYLREIVTGNQPRVDVLIVNELDYITKALTPEQLDDAMRAATNYINGQIDKGIAKAGKELPT